MHSKHYHFNTVSPLDIATKETKDKVTATIKDPTLQFPIKLIMANLAFGPYFQREPGF